MQMEILMMQPKYYLYSLCAVLAFLPVARFADNAWGNYRGFERPTYSQPSAPAYQPDPFAFSNQRYTPTAPPKGYYYQSDRNDRYPYHRQSGVRIEYYPDTQYDYRYEREGYVVGGVLPSELRSERYVLRDWRAYDLYEPPRGRHWVIVDGRYLLVTDDHFTIEIVR